MSPPCFKFSMGSRPILKARSELAWPPPAARLVRPPAGRPPGCAWASGPWSLFAFLLGGSSPDLSLAGSFSSFRWCFPQSGLSWPFSNSHLYYSILFYSSHLTLLKIIFLPNFFFIICVLHWKVSSLTVGTMFNIFSVVSLYWHVSNYRMDECITIHINFLEPYIHQPNMEVAPRSLKGFHTAVIICKHWRFYLALVASYQLANATSGFSVSPLSWWRGWWQSVQWGVPACILSHAGLSHISKWSTETSRYNAFHYEISVSFQELCFFFCHHICQRPLNILSLFLFFKKLKWLWRESGLYYWNVIYEQRIVLLKSCLAQEPGNLTHCFLVKTTATSLNEVSFAVKRKIEP